MAQMPAKIELLLDHLGIDRLEQLRPAAAGLLGHVERQVRVPHGGLGRRAMLRQARDADGGADESLALGEVHGARQPGDDPIGKPGQRGVGHAASLRQHGEFVAAEPGDEGVAAPAPA